MDVEGNGNGTINSKFYYKHEKQKLSICHSIDIQYAFILYFNEYFNTVNKSDYTFIFVFHTSNAFVSHTYYILSLVQ
jgi:hypothetical protein